MAGATRVSLKDISHEKGKLKHLKRCLSYLSPYKLLIFGAFISLLVTSGAVLSLGKGVGYLVDQGLGGNNPALLDSALFILTAITAILAIGTFARFFLITLVGEKVVNDIRRDIYAHLITLSPSFFETHKSGDILSRMTTDTTLIQIVVSSSLSVALRNSLLLMGGIGLLISSSPKLAMIVGLVVPMVVAPIIILGKRLRKLSKTAQERVSSVAAHTEETIAGIKTVQSFTREELEKATFAIFLKDALHAASKRITIRSLLTAIVIMFVFGAIGVVLWVGGHDVLAGTMTAGALSSFLFYALVVAGATGAVSEVIGDLQRAAGAAERIMDLLSIEPEIHSPLVHANLPAHVAGNIHFDHVQFNYPSRPDTKSLNDVSFIIEPGSKVAIVGPSGAGKSTIFQLLLRFYDSQEGNITLDGVNIRHLNIQELRQQFSSVPQDPLIFSGSVMDNILVGDNNANHSDVYAAAKAASAHEFIEQLPQGYDTFLGEKGTRLSGGQKQRIAIARALLKNAPILLLDEATSALDSAHENLVQEAMEKLMENRTTLIIAHRFSTIEKADMILVLDHGKIVEYGTHNELLKQGGLYKKLSRIPKSAELDGGF